jgi:hypothetical protein
MLYGYEDVECLECIQGFECHCLKSLPSEPPIIAGCEFLYYQEYTVFFCVSLTRSSDGVHGLSVRCVGKI